MTGGRVVRANVIAKHIEFAILIALAFALPASAQRNFGGIPPSVTSTSPFGVHAPPPLPSVTSIPNDNFRFNNGFRSFNRGRGGYGYGYPAYTVPYYYPFDSSLYGSDYVGGGGGPDLYSGPPPGPNESILHVIVEQPPASAYASPRAEPPPEQPAPATSVEVPEVKPGEPTLLVFRNGKHEEVTNYAIMGDTLYVFDQGRKKIALADLDLPATVKANDDRGTEFRTPSGAAKKKAVAPAPQSARPDDTSDAQPKKTASLFTAPVSE